MPEPLSIQTVSPEMIQAIRANAAHFPAYVQSRGRSYVADGRVGPLEVTEEGVRATVRGTRKYRTMWRWDGAKRIRCAAVRSGPCASTRTRSRGRSSCARRGSVDDDSGRGRAARGRGRAGCATRVAANRSRTPSCARSRARAPTSWAISRTGRTGRRGFGADAARRCSASISTARDRWCGWRSASPRRA